MRFKDQTLESLVDHQTTLFWFRRDLRIEDNAGLYHALKENINVLPVFIFDTRILDNLDNKADRRVEFIYQSLEVLKKEFESVGSSVVVLHGDPVQLFKTLNPKAVYTNNDYEPYARNRDEQVSQILSDKGSCLKSYKDHVIFEKNEILKDNDEPYSIFTPYSKKWKSALNKLYLIQYPTSDFIGNLKKTEPLPLISMNEIGFKKTGAEFPERKIKLSVISGYEKTRNYPAVSGTTRLSVHLRFGTVSIRELVRLALKKNETWLNELIWRDFYQMILWHFPHVEKKAFKPAYDRIIWRNDIVEFEAWCQGKTGYPIVDAGMRELNCTGFMHNRVRMIVASFLTKHLLIDWRWGEAYFAEKLLDYDLAANNGGWQWAAGSGCDASPYFRVFNPQLQTEKFDPEMKYIKKWIHDLSAPTYPKPIVAHSFARERALKTYHEALRK